MTAGFAGALADARLRFTDAEPDPWRATGELHDRDGHTLTPAALHARWLRDGLRALEGLHGGFAVVLWDERTGAGVLAVDRLGAGAIFAETARGPGALRFATELAPLLDLLPATPAPDGEAVARWAATSRVPVGRTLYAGVRRLPGGHALVVADGRWRLERLWRPAPPASRRARHAPADVAGEARARLDAAVARALPASPQDGGVLLSGGLDSATIAALAARRRPGVQAWSARFPGDEAADEGPQIQALTRAYDVTAHAVAFRGGSALGAALDYAERWRTPLVSPNAFVWREVWRRAADRGVRVMLDGEGGDELFGLSPFAVADLLARGRPLAALRLLQRVPGMPRRPPARVVAANLRRMGGAAIGTPARRKREPWRAHGRPLAWAHLLHLLTHNREEAGVHDHLRRQAGEHGITDRHPLLDSELVDWVLALPPDLAFSAAHDRPLLRAATDGLVPDEVRLRTGKATFNGPFERALRNRDGDLVADLLVRRRPRLAEFVDLEALRGDLAGWETPAGRAAAGTPVLWTAWRAAALEVWLAGVEDRDAPRRLREAADLDAPDVG